MKPTSLRFLVLLGLLGGAGSLAVAGTAPGAVAVATDGAKPGGGKSDKDKAKPGGGKSDKDKAKPGGGKPDKDKAKPGGKPDQDKAKPGGGKAKPGGGQTDDAPTKPGGAGKGEGTTPTDEPQPTEGSQPGKPNAADKKAAEGGAKPSFPDRRAFICGIKVTSEDDLEGLRVTIGLTYPKAKIEAEIKGQAQYTVTIPGTLPCDDIPRRIAVAKDVIADILVKPTAKDTVIVVRLNCPSKCRAYVVPSKRQVVIECAKSDDQPDAKTDDTASDSKDEITVEFVDTDIRVVLQALVSQSGANILLQPGVTGNYSLSLKNVTLTQALDALWEAWGLVWMEMPGSIYLVGTASDLGSRRADVMLTPPQGWSAVELWQTLRFQFPDLKLQRELATVPDQGPLPIFGPLKSVGQARRWVAQVPPAEGAPKPVGPERKEETLPVYCRHLKPGEAVELLKAEFPGLTITADADGGKVTITGPRADALKAKRRLSELDVEPSKDVEEAVWIPLVPPEKIREIAQKVGVTAEVVHTDTEGTLVYLRGREDKVKVMRSLTQQLQDLVTKRKEQERKDTESEKATVTRSYQLGTMSVEQAQRVVAATGLPVEVKADGTSLQVTGRGDRVAQVLAALSQADSQQVRRVYKVRYGRPQDLVRLVRNAVPELRLVDFNAVAEVGDAGVVDVRRLGPPTPVKETKEAPDAKVTTTAEGPAPIAAATEAVPVGRSARLVLIGPADAVERALAFLAEVDVPPAEVELSAVIAEVTPATAQALGVDSLRPVGAGLSVGNMARGPMDLAAAAATIGRDERSRLLARPTLRTTDGQRARLLLGQRISFQTVRQVDGQPQPVQGQDRVGVVLDMVPTVPGDGTVVCRLHPEVSQLVGTGPGGTTVATREAETTLRVSDGGTVVIAGLLRESDPAAKPAERTELIVLLSVKVVSTAPR